jgi:hypothetical protein
METLLTTSACTMPTIDRPTRVAEFDVLFAEHATSVEREGDVARVHLRGPGSLRARVQDLTDRETSCCSFFTFTLSGTDTEYIHDIAVPPARPAVLDSKTARASELSVRTAL